jgi:ketosteroid isomerase-like protein
MVESKASRQIEIAQEYFKRLDAGTPDLIELFTDDVQIYFPKFGIGRGREALGEMAMKLVGHIESAEHKFDTYLYAESGNVLMVEGTTKGRLRNGAEWSAGETPGGRFCDVFEFRDGLISRLHIYLDPDYGGYDEDRFLWGREGRNW